MVNLQPDCGRCVGLCCLALAIDKGEAFAFDKPAGLACGHLTLDHGCAIHSELSARGCDGCVQYSCEGAGQRVVQELFSGQSWQQDPALKAPMIAAFQAMRMVHKYLSLLKTAQALPLDTAQDTEGVHLLAMLTPVDGWSEERLRDFTQSGLVPRLKTFFSGLQAVALSVQTGKESEI